MPAYASKLVRGVARGGEAVVIRIPRVAGDPAVGLFFFNDTATTEIYTLSLHDALPIWRARQGAGRVVGPEDREVDRPRSIRPTRARERRLVRDRPPRRRLRRSTRRHGGRGLRHHDRLGRVGAGRRPRGVAVQVP